MTFLEYIKEPWPWYVAGPMMAFIVVLLLFFGKSFGISSNLRTMCSMAGAGRLSNFFKFNWKDNIWNLVFILGAMIGGFTSHYFLSNNEPVDLNESTIIALRELGIDSPDLNLVPEIIFGGTAFHSLWNLVYLFVGGLLVGFGARYAGGCTSGHAISGLSNLQWPSLIAVIGFFIGGLIMTHLILPLIF